MAGSFVTGEIIIQGPDVGVFMEPSFINELFGTDAEYQVYVGTTPGSNAPFKLLAQSVKVFVVISTISPTILNHYRKS